MIAFCSNFSSRFDCSSRRLGPPVVVVAFVALSGCSYVPAPLNPINWYQATVGAIFGDEPSQVSSVSEAQPIPGEEKAFPNLADVPEAPSAEQREQISEGLRADTVNRRYEDELVEADGETFVLAEETVTEIVPAQPVLPSDGTPAAAPRMDVEITETTETVEMVAAAPPPNPVGDMLEAQLTGEAAALAEAEGLEAVEIAEDEALGPNSLEKFDASRSVVSVLVGKILFANGSANLSGGDRRELKKIADDYKKSGGTVRVIGFASSYTGNVDPLKHQIINFDVSMRRAQIVAASLMKYGVAPKDIFVGAKSDSEPVYYEVMPAGQAGNRRTEVYLDF